MWRVGEGTRSSYLFPGMLTINVLLVHPSAWVGQSLLSADNPTQSSPPLAGGGLVQVRFRLETPCKQYVGSEHVLQEDHIVKPPSIAP